MRSRLYATLAASLLLVSACACLKSAQRQEPGVPGVITSEQAGKNRGERVRIVGVAERAKIAPVVVSDQGFSVYCLDLEDWPPGVQGKRVEVEGVLEQTDQFQAYVDENGAVSQGTGGGDWVMRHTTVRVVE